MSDIFISYARKDRDRAKPLAEALEAQGWDVWWDPKIPPGKTFADVIDDEISAANCILALWSKVSINKNWVLEEAQDGLERGILVPVLIEDVKPPRGFRRIQAANLIEWDGSGGSPGFQTLVSSVADILGSPPVAIAKEERRQAEEVKRNAEEEKQKQEEESKRQQEAAEAKRKAEQEERKRAEEAKRKAEEEGKRAEEAKRKAEEEKQKQEEESKRQQEAAEAKRKAEQAERKRDAEAKHKVEEEARRKTEEAYRKVGEETRRKREAEAAKRKAELAERKRAKEAKQKAEKEAKRKEEETEREAEAERKGAEEAQRNRQFAEAARRNSEAEHKRAAEAKHKVEEAARRKTEEAYRKVGEETRRKREAEAAKRKAAEEEKQRRNITAKSVTDDVTKTESVKQPSVEDGLNYEQDYGLNTEQIVGSFTFGLIGFILVNILFLNHWVPQIRGPGDLFYIFILGLLSGSLPGAFVGLIVGRLSPLSMLFITVGMAIFGMTYWFLGSGVDTLNELILLAWMIGAPASAIVAAVLQHMISRTNLRRH